MLPSIETMGLISSISVGDYFQASGSGFEFSGHPLYPLPLAYVVYTVRGYSDE